MLVVCVFFNLFNGVSKEYIFVPLVHEHIVFFEDLACSSSFWKKMEPFFCFCQSYLKQEVVTRIHDYNYESYFYFGCSLILCGFPFETGSAAMLIGA